MQNSGCVGFLRCHCFPNSPTKVPTICPCPCVVRIWHVQPRCPAWPVEAAREKIKHFLRKFILFFVSLFVILFHFLKATVTSLFILPITYNQLTTCFTSFVSTNCIGKRKLGNPEVFK